MDMSKEKRHLVEAGAFASDAANDDGTWKIKVISEGKGSSGTYPASLLESYHHAFDNVLSFKNHPGEWEGPQSRDFTMIAGEVVGETWVDRDEQGKTAIFANYRPDPEYKDKLERYKGKLGISIYIEGSGYVDESSGEFVVDWLNEHDPFASADVVLAAGRGGKFMESMRKVYAQEGVEKTSTASVEDKNESEGTRMDKDIEERFNALESLIQGLTDSKQEAAKAEADEAAVQAEADKRVSAIVAGLEAVESARADLLPSQVASITESAKRGEDVAPAIESAKAIAAEAREAFGKNDEAGETGRLGESANSAYELKGFGGRK